MEINPINSTDWGTGLSAEEYRVLRERGTEAPFSGKYVDEKRKGTYACRACGSALFSSEHKYDSGSGWPSFTQGVETAPIATIEDTTHGMRRTEVVCSNCESHLGHVFPDGPREHGGLRYCINSISLDLQPGAADAML